MTWKQRPSLRHDNRQCISHSHLCLIAIPKGDAWLLALASRDVCRARLAQAGHGEITTGIESAPTFYYAEDYHQQYLARNRYCPAPDF